MVFENERGFLFLNVKSTLADGAVVSCNLSPAFFLPDCVATSLSLCVHEKACNNFIYGKKTLLPCVVFIPVLLAASAASWYAVTCSVAH